MEFATPFAFALLLLDVPVVLLAFRPRRRKGVTLTSTAALSKARPTRRLRLSKLLPILRQAAILLLVCGLARPRTVQADATINARGVDVVLALDISGSMDSPFAKGATRLQAAKAVINDFIGRRQDNRIGLVAFRSQTLALSPPTVDYHTLQAMLAEIEKLPIQDGTAIGLGIAEATNLLKGSTSTSRAVILLTDGQHNEPSISPEAAAGLAKAVGVRLYTVGIMDRGTAGRSTEVDEKRMKDIAELTGGHYFAADNPQALADIYETISNLEQSRVSHDRFEQFREYGPWFMAGAALLIVSEIVLRSSWLRRTPA